VSLPEDEVEFLDAYAKARGIPSRSAAMKRAIRSLRVSELAGNYADAWEEWTEASEETWAATTGDGIPS